MDTATIILSLSMVGATIADVETTRSGIQRGGYEFNPLMRPFADSRVELYMVKGTINTGIGIFSCKLRRSPRKRDRIFGWALPVFSVAAQGAAAVHNHKSNRR